MNKGSVNQKTFNNGDSFTGKWVANNKIYRLRPAHVKELIEDTR
jgi:hypothetical protein